MINKFIKIILLYFRALKGPLYIDKKIIYCDRFLGRICKVDFDREFYLECYSDIRQNGIDPVLHYYCFGRSEGRIGVPFDPIIDRGKMSRARETVLLVTHELTATGAPVLAFNIAKELCKKYNVLAISLGKGELSDEFSKLGVNLFCEPALRHSEAASKYFIQKLHEQAKVKVALVNSIESFAVLSGLYEIGIPVVSLLHEFPSYSGGLDRYRRCIYWSTFVLLSSDMLKNDLLKTGQLADSEKLLVLPQGKCTVPSYHNEGGVAVHVTKSSDVIRVVGAGTITYRKGVDLFIECAREIREKILGRQLEFLWIGKNVDSVLGTDYCQYLEDQISRSGLKGCFSFVRETDRYEELLSTADVFLLTSRLDPLPNVAIDAFAKGLPVFFFKEVSGLSSLIAKTDLEGRLCADYLSPSDLAGKVAHFVLDEKKDETLAKLREFYSENFRFDKYMARLERCLEMAVDSHDQMIRDAAFIRENSGINPCFCAPKIWNRFGVEDIHVRYVNMWRSNVYKYRPSPDIQPGIYRELVGPQGDPYVHYIKSGRPAGPWKNDLVNLNQSRAEAGSGLSVALHIHCYYPELLKDILLRLSENSSKVDVYVSTNTIEKKEEIFSVFAEIDLVPASIDVSPNIGRDVGPFLNLYCSALADRYDVIFHVHTKKSPHVDESDGKNWYEYCLNNLLGGVGGNVLDKIVWEFRDKSLGLVYPSDPNVLGWGDNLKFSEEVLGRLGLKAKTGDFNFPIGTMFAASKLLVRRLGDLNFQWDDYPREPLPIDGTMLHAIERSIPFVCEGLGLRQMLVYVNKTTRI